MDKCQDSFSYVTMSEWVGKGPTQQSVISINPVSRDIAIAAGLSADPLKSAAGEAQQLTAETADVKSGQCNAKYPTGTVVGLGVAILCLMAPLAIVFNHIKKINDAVSASEKKTSELPESPSAYNSTDQLRRDPMQERNSLRPLRKESEEVKPEAGKEDNWGNPSESYKSWTLIQEWLKNKFKFKRGASGLDSEGYHFLFYSQVNKRKSYNLI